jgi:hypothetical protein
MAVKIKSSFDINASEMQALVSIYAKFNTALNQSNSNWTKINKSVNIFTTSLNILNKTVAAGINSINILLNGHVALNTAARNANNSFNNMATTTTKILNNFNNISRSVFGTALSFASPLGILTGLITTAVEATVGAAIGGYWLLGEGSSSVLARRRASLGLGVSYGALGAFDLHFSRFGNPQQFLGATSSGVYDVTSPEYATLAGLGVSRGGGVKPDSAAINLLQKMTPLLDKVGKENTGGIGTVANAYGLTNFWSLKEIIAYIRASPEERQTQIDAFRSDSKTLNLSKEAQIKWSNFSITLSRSGIKLEKVLGEVLGGKFIPALTKMSESIVHIVTVASENKNLINFINSAETGLNHFVDYLKSDTFSQAKNKLLSGLETLTPIIGKILKTTWAVTKGSYRGISAIFNDNTVSWWQVARAVIDPSYTIPEHRGNAGVGGWWTKDRRDYAINYLIKNAGLSPMGAAGLVARWSAIEATGGPTSVNPKSGAAGIAQGLGSRREGYLGDFDSQLANAAHELNTTEKAAAEKLRHAQTAIEASTGASMFERAEHYNSITGVDDYTYQTPTNKVYDDFYGLGSTKNVPITNNSNVMINGN